MGLINQAKEKNLEGSFVSSRKTLKGWVRNSKSPNDGQVEIIRIKPKTIMILISHFIDSTTYYELISVFHNNRVIDFYLTDKQGAAHAIDFNPTI